MTEQAETQTLTGGELLAEISRRMVRLMRERAGKGPTRAKTFWAGPDMLIVVLGGGFSAAERTLYENGHGEQVLSFRGALQQAMKDNMRQAVEELTGRTVIAFMSATHQEPDLSAEIFTLESQAADDGGELSPS